MLGPHGGEKGTVRVHTFTEHIPAILNYPDATPAIPYIELLWAPVPAYKPVKVRAT